MQAVTNILTPSIQRVDSDDFFLTIGWNNGHSSKFPFIFLRDNAIGNRHGNGQKLTETGDLSINVHAEKVYLRDKYLCVKWNDKDEEDSFSHTWLLKHDLLMQQSARKEKEDQQLWDAGIQRVLPENDFAAVCADNRELADWLDKIRRYGFALLRDVYPRTEMVLEVIRLFGYVRETNYGKVFNVKTVLQPNNLAYTGLGISAHTDNPYRHPVPTLQLLHCLSSDTLGGDSVLADGFKIAEDLRAEFPFYFKLLSTTMVRYQFRDEANWIEHTTSIIQLEADGTIAAIALNNRSIQPLQLAAWDLLEFYRAYLQFVKMTNDKKYQVHFKMSPGDLYIVDNERVLHARTAYDDTGGTRWLQGAYADKDGLLSKWRILNHQLNEPDNL